MTLDKICYDVVAAVRALRNAPTFSTICIAVIGLGIGPNLFVASIVATILLLPLPFPEPGALLFLQETNSGRSLNFPDAERLARRSGNVAQIALGRFDAKTLTGMGRAAYLQGGVVSWNYFDVLGVPPRIGRLFSSGERRTDGVVISEDLWRSRLGGDSSALGRRLRLDGHEYEIIGVAPSRFEDPTPYGLIHRDFWLVIDSSDQSQVAPHSYNYIGIARANAGVAPSTAASQLRTILSSIVKEEPKGPPGFYAIDASSLQDRIIGPVAPLLWILYAAASLVLLTAVANIISLLVARNAFRSGALAIRSAVGATRTQLFIELAAEGLVLAVAGAAVGLALAWIGLHAVADVASQILPRWSEVKIAAPTLLYALLLVMCMTVLMAAAPAFADRGNVWEALKTARQSSARRANRISAFLVIAEISLATALLLIGALLLRSFAATLDVPLGFSPSNTSIVTIPTLSGGRYATASAVALYASKLTEAIESIPGVVSASPAAQLPFLCCSSAGFSIPGHKETNPFSALYNPVGIDYFRALRVPVASGRAFNSGDRDGTALVAIVDETFQDQFLGGTNAIGKRLQLSGSPTNVATIVGVVGNVRQDFVQLPRPTIYVPIAQDPQLRMIVVRNAGSAQNLPADVDAVFRRIDPDVAAPTVLSYGEILNQHVLAARLTLGLFATLSVIALGLALAGIYGIASYSMIQRRIEFGIRKALGATSHQLLGTAIFRIFFISVIGCVAGIALSECVAPFFNQLLYHTSPIDAPSLTVVSVLVVAAAVAATLPPAFRSARVDPASALRNE